VLGHRDARPSQMAMRAVILHIAPLPRMSTSPGATQCSIHHDEHHASGISEP
jgi:hypothetical protein